MRYRTGRILHWILMLWVTSLFLLGWLPLLRSLMDGPSYEWGHTFFGTQFRGAGTSGDLWFLLAKTAIGAVLLWLGWRRPNGAFRLALVTLLAVMLADSLHTLATQPGGAQFEGATLGVSFSTAILGPVLDAAMLALAAWWFPKAPPMRVPPLGAANYIIIAAAILLLPLQYLLLRSGQGQQFNDVAGVLLTIAGWYMLSLGLAPWRVAGEGEEQLARA